MYQEYILILSLYLMCRCCLRPRAGRESGVAFLWPGRPGSAVENRGVYIAPLCSDGLPWPHQARERQQSVSSCCSVIVGVPGAAVDLTNLNTLML